MAKWTKKQIKEQFAWTSECYRSALIEHYSNDFSDEDKKHGTTEELREMVYDLYGKDYNTPELTAVYMKHVLQLDTKKLTTIVEVYRDGHQRRSGSTIELILTELFERSANPETKE